jgi:aminopeptidase N
MKQNYFLIASLAISLLFSSTSFSQSGHLCAKSKISAHQQERSNTLPLNYIALTEEYDVHFYQFNINVENTNTNISGVVDMHATVKVNILDTILYELHSNLAINSVKVNGVNTPYTRVGSAVIIPVNFTMGDQFIVSTDYVGSSGGMGMSNGSSGSWGNQVTWTLSESFNAYHWFPCKQSLTDKIDSVYFYATTDSTNMVGSNGLLTNVADLNNGKKRYEWQTRYPIDYYLISFSVAEYVEYNIYANPVGAANPILVQNFIYNNPQTLPYFQADIDKTVDFIEYFSTIYGLYPFHQEKYGHCMAPFGGGMEHQTMTTQGWFEDGLTTHELGHQWFGDNVTCASWSDIWLNEGFASYSEYLMEEHFNPGNEVSLMQNVHDNVLSQPDGSVWVLDSLNENRIFSGRLTYDKGSAIIHTLRFLINDDAKFFQILQQYQIDFSDSTAHASDFKAIAEQVSGLDLSEFFSDWYYGEGYPTYSVEWAFDNTSSQLYLKLLQASPFAYVPFFNNDLELRLIGTDGNIQVVRLDNINTNGQIFEMPFTASLGGITIDPNNWIVNKVGNVTQNPNLIVEASLKEVEHNIKIYPNPVSEVLYITNSTNNKSLLIYDVTGKLISNQSIQEGLNVVDVKTFAKGTYLIKIGAITNEIIIK